MYRNQHTITQQPTDISNSSGIMGISTVAVILSALVFSQVAAQDDNNYDSDDIYYFMNEVELKTGHAVDAANEVIDVYLTGNLPEAVDQKIEITGKAQRSVDLVADWITAHNASGELVGEKGSCVVTLLSSTNQEAQEYLGYLDQVCGNGTGWVGSIQGHVDNFVQLAADGKKLYKEFLDQNLMCTMNPDPLTCAANVEKTIRDKGTEILKLREEYLSGLYSTYEEFQGSVNVCQKIVYEKIDNIELNVLNGLRDCDWTNQSLP